MTVLTLDAARIHLNITGYEYDNELTGIIATAEAAIAQWCGPLEQTTITERIRGSVIALRTTPVVSLTSMTPVGGTAYVLNTLDLDATAGLVTLGSGGTFGSSTRYDIVYVAGRTVCPPDLLLAVKELTRHLWQSQRGPASFPGIAEGLPGATGGAYLMPYRVQELIEPHIQQVVA